MWQLPKRVYPRLKDKSLNYIVLTQEEVLYENKVVLRTLSAIEWRCDMIDHILIRVATRQLNVPYMCEHIRGVLFLPLLQ